MHEAQRLQLESEQRQYEEAREPLAPLQKEQLHRRLDAQRREQIQLQQQQMQQQRALQRQLNTLPPGAARQKQLQQLQQDRREQDQQQLQFELQRKTWPYPRR